MPPEVLGIDIGGTAVKLGLIDQEGRVTAREEMASPAKLSPAEGLAVIARAARHLGPGTAPMIGVGCAGLVDSRRGIVHTSPNLPQWRDVPLSDLLTVELGAPVRVLNDANAFTLAEARIGAGRHCSPVVGLTLGTGVGGAIVADGRLMEGRHGFAGEVGHMSIDHQGPACPCGNRGCLEHYVGKRGIVAAYLRRARWEAGEVPFELTGGRQEGLTPKVLAEAAAQGDPRAQEAFAEIGAALGVALANLANLIDPEIFVIGGGVAQAGELILAPARRVMTERAMAFTAALGEVVPAGLGVDAGIIGAGLFALDGARGS